MLKSGHEDMGVKEFIEHTKNTLAYEGYNHDNYILVRACEIMLEQEKKINSYQETLEFIGGRTK
jgi:hypothetical protein